MVSGIIINIIRNNKNYYIEERNIEERKNCYIDEYVRTHLCVEEGIIRIIQSLYAAHEKGR